MFYSGESNVPGAPGNFLAGNPSFDTMKRRGITPGGGPQLPLAGIPGSSNLPGAIGNMGGLANAGMFYGPQYGQALAGFAGKTLS